jgi:hypothetical protein
MWLLQRSAGGRLELTWFCFDQVMNCFAWVIQHHPDLTKDQFKVAGMFLLQSLIAQLAISAMCVLQRLLSVSLPSHFVFRAPLD